LLDDEVEDDGTMVREMDLVGVNDGGLDLGPGVGLFLGVGATEGIRRGLLKGKQVDFLDGSLLGAVEEGIEGRIDGRLLGGKLSASVLVTSKSAQREL